MLSVTVISVVSIRSNLVSIRSNLVSIRSNLSSDINYFNQFLAIEWVHLSVGSYYLSIISHNSSHLT
jgi:hypothetical protein